MNKDNKTIEQKNIKDSEKKQSESLVVGAKDAKGSDLDKENTNESKVEEKKSVVVEKTTNKIEKKDDGVEVKKKGTKADQNSKIESKSKTNNKTLTSSISKDKQKKTSNSENKPNDSKASQSDNSGKNYDQGEFIEKLVSINRVAKVVKGGRRFSFAALVVVGDGNGMVGHGKGKAKEVPEAIKKATDEAKNNLIRVPLRQGRTLHHDIKGRFDSGIVYLRSAPSGTGVIAGGPMRAVFEALGVQDIVAKSVGTSNPHNMVRATFEALKSASSPKIIAMRRNLKINDITKRRKNSPQGGESVKN